ncbi:hypothetical protein [Mariprofundus ferrooxydans]|uniref:hypothetical protein n=1 Tax=Mariprofundus ferrooxydans TaxID=314344 RepID=UPI0006A6DEEB|nr:hypothetical protein [Mariprofundus ferrooxydans]KON48494.1 hypothetical protein AL013_02360 [Mariprofundus ferrooxydans]
MLNQQSITKRKPSSHQTIKINKEKEMRENIVKAIEVYLSRSCYSSHPDGRFDNAKRWYPSASEERFCCDDIRPPSRAYPSSLNKHCRSIKHIAALYDVDETILRRVARKVAKGVSTIEAVNDAMK